MNRTISFLIRCEGSILRPLASSAKRVLGLLITICFCFVAVSLFSENYHDSFFEHDCCGEGCPVCLLMLREDYSRQFKCAVFYSCFFVNPRLMTVFTAEPAAFRFIPLNSVALKVKMNR